MILWNTVSAVKQPVRGLSPHEMTVAEAVRREGAADLATWTRSIASSASPAAICATWNTDARCRPGTDLVPGFDPGPSPSHALQWCRTFHTQPTLTPLRPCTDPILVESLVPLLPAIVHLKAPAVKPNHQEKGQSKDPHLGYELMIALQTFRLLHTTINAWKGERLTGGRWIQRAKESETFDQEGVQWITWTGVGTRSGCSQARSIESWELLRLHQAGDHLLDPCRLARRYTSHPSADQPA